MQSDSNRNSYLSQSKDNISSEQKATRQLYETTNEEAIPSGSRQHLDKDNIPPIDDEFAEQVSQERRYKSRFSYFDEEAEASLQFFKKNLSTQAKTKPPSSGNLFDRSPLLNFGTKNSDNNNIISRSDITANERVETRKERPSSFAETKFSGQRSYQSSQLVPLRQTSLGNKPAPRFERSTAKSNYATKNSSANQPVENNYERKPRDHVSTTNPAQRLRSYERPRIEATNLDDNDDRIGDDDDDDILTRKPIERPTYQGGTQNRNSLLPQSGISGARGISPDGRRSTATNSPSQNGTFSRKPLYNSLLRAHDSIRLKVNRPKVRPKSQGPQGPDTVVDDSIQLAEIRTSNDELNERAVDVKRSSSRKKNKKKNKDAERKESKEKLPIRNFSEVRVVKVVRNESEKSLGVTVRAEDGNIVVARIMAGSLADKQGALQVGDLILSVNNREVYTPEQLQEELRKSINDDTVIMKIVPSFREELPNLCLYLRALFNYDANEDTLLPCKEVGVSFNQGDILEVVNQEDPNWWQARRVDSENLQTGLIPSQELEERRRAFVIPDYDLATRTSICGTKVTRKSKKKEIYNIGQNCDFDKAELQLYEEVCRTPAFERRTLVLIGANGVGKQALKARLISMDPERFGAPLPHTSRLPRDGEEDGVHYHFVTREMMEEDIIDGKYLEFGEYDGALYGTKLDSVREIIGSGKVCVLDCSPTCLKVLKTSDYLPFVAFIAAPTLDQLRYMHEWARSGNKNYTTFDRALSRQSRRARTLQDFAFDFFEDEDLQLTIEESARLFRIYENHFDIVLVNNNFETTFASLREAIDALSMAPQWIPISWIYGT